MTNSQTPPLKMPREFLFDTQGFEGKHSNGLTSWLQSSHETISCSVVSLDAGGLIIRFGSCVSTEIHPGVPLPIPPPPKMIKSTGWTRVDNLSCPLISPSSFNDNDVRAAPLLWKLFLLLSVRYFQFFLLNHYPSSSSPSAFPLNFFFFFLFVSLLTRVTAFTQVN